MDYKLQICKSENYRSIMKIWNEAIDEGKTLPWLKHFTLEEVQSILENQVAAYCAFCNKETVGFYILHPNYSGRSSHIANALYIVKNSYRGQGIGTSLIKHSIRKAKEAGFMAMQYNSVVASNYSLGIYNKLGFEVIGRIKKGFKITESQYDDLLILYYNMEKDIEVL